MKHYLIYILVFSTGVIISGGVTWVSSYYPPLEPRQDSVKIEDILIFSEKEITDENNFCDDSPDTNVAAITGSIMGINSSYKRNMLTLECSNNTCTYAVTSCMPWQKQECGERILKFNINNENKIQPDTFMCIDVP